MERLPCQDGGNRGKILEVEYIDSVTIIHFCRTEKNMQKLVPLHCSTSQTLIHTLTHLSRL